MRMRFHFPTRTDLNVDFSNHSSISSESPYLTMLNDQYFMRNDVATLDKGKSDHEDRFRWSYDNFDHDETDFHLQIVPQIHKEEEDDSKKDLLVVVPDEHSETGDNDDSDTNRSYLRFKHKKPKRLRIEISSDHEESELGFTREVPSVTQKCSKRRRRDEMSNKIRTLQQLLPNCHKTDKVSVLDNAIEYMRNLKLQLQVMSTMAMNPYFPPATLDFGIHNHLLTAMAVTYGQNLTNQTTSSPLIPPLNWPLPPLTNLSLIPQASGQSPFLPTASSPQWLYGFVPYYSSFLNL